MCGSCCFSFGSFDLSVRFANSQTSIDFIFTDRIDPWNFSWLWNHVVLRSASQHIYGKLSFWLIIDRVNGIVKLVNSLWKLIEGSLKMPWYNSYARCAHGFFILSLDVFININCILFGKSFNGVQVNKIDEVLFSRKRFKQYWGPPYNKQSLQIHTKFILKHITYNKFTWFTLSCKVLTNSKFYHKLVYLCLLIKSINKIRYWINTSNIRRSKRKCNLFQQYRYPVPQNWG